MASQSKKILIVEDDPFIGDLIISDLSQLFPYGNLVVIGPVENMQDAIAAFNNETPDMILMDIELGQDKSAGISLASLVNQIRPVPLIFLSGLERERGFDVAKYTSPYAYLQKPYQRQQLADIIELLLIQLTTQIKKPNPDLTTYQKTQKSIFVTTSYGEITAIELEHLTLIEADGKVLKAYNCKQDRPIIFSSPGLKNFYESHLEILSKDFFQLSRKFIINISKIEQIKDNLVRLPKFTSDSRIENFQIPIPVNGNKKKELFKLLGKTL
ncbi:response regulator transcription factor [Belliella kenyensis]|uniref:Response regulator transcription factor n=1 Tax=Belliella kenyensis TaxID=1472724 RepID=A0ABV8EQZ8_9BACT|nr:response regulator [Belliella kenyensis]MCH7402791.1 response regulator [Belliella kenyensis]MDN3602496.1 response regulator [Belliella kenyensis]